MTRQCNFLDARRRSRADSDASALALYCSLFGNVRTMLLLLGSETDGVTWPYR